MKTLWAVLAAAGLILTGCGDSVGGSSRVVGGGVQKPPVDVPLPANPQEPGTGGGEEETPSVGGKLVSSASGSTPPPPPTIVR